MLAFDRNPDAGPGTETPARFGLPNNDLRALKPPRAAPLGATAVVLPAPRASAAPHCSLPALLLGLALWLALPSIALADDHAATSGHRAKKAAIDAMPLDKLDAQARERVMAVLKKTSVYRRMPIAVTRCDPDLYLFILNHPEILANIWQLMQIENVVLKATGPNSYHADDGDGTKGEVEFLYRGNDLQLVYARGSYEGPLFTHPITGTAVMLLRSSFTRAADGHCYVTTQLDAFVHLDDVGLDFLAKTFQPLVCRVADYNFVVTAQFVEALSRAAEVNQIGIQRLAANLQQLDPRVRAQFSLLAAEVAQRALARAEVSVEPKTRLAQRRTAADPGITE